MYLFDRIQFFVFILLLPIKFQQNYLDAFVGEIDKFALFMYSKTTRIM